MILCQEGYQANSLITSGLQSGALDGAILSPRYHSPVELAHCCERYAADGAFVMVDPEFHLSLLSDASVMQLREYDHFRSGLRRRDFSGTAIEQFVSEALTLQRECNVSALVSPTVALDSFEDWRSQVFLSLAEESVAQHDASEDPPLYLTLVLGDAFLTDSAQVFDLLDMVTTLNCKGFYLVANRLSAQDTLWTTGGSAVQLANLAYVASALSGNGFDIIYGYAGLDACVLMASGASAVASGWFKSQRSFCLGRYLAGPSYGRQPRPAYPSLPLMSWLYLSPDLEVIREQGWFDRVASGSPDDDALRLGRFDSWRRAETTGGLWGVLRQMQTDWGSGDPESRRALAGAMAEAAALANELHRSLPLESSFSHLANWREAMSELSRKLGESADE